MCGLENQEELSKYESAYHEMRLNVDSQQPVGLENFYRQTNVDELPSAEALDGIRRGYQHNAAYVKFLDEKLSDSEIEHCLLDYPIVCFFNLNEEFCERFNALLVENKYETIRATIGYTEFHYKPAEGELSHDADSQKKQYEIDNIRYKIYCTKFNVMLLHSVKHVFKDEDDRIAFLSEALIKTDKLINVYDEASFKELRDQYLELVDITISEKTDRLSKCLKPHGHRVSENYFINQLTIWMDAPLKSNRLMSYLLNRPHDDDNFKKEFFKFFWGGIASFASSQISEGKTFVPLVRDGCFDSLFQYTISERYDILPQKLSSFFNVLNVDIKRYLTDERIQTGWKWGTFSIDNGDLFLNLKKPEDAVQSGAILNSA